MIETNTMQRGTDTFQFRKQALLKTSDPLVTKGETSVSGFTISGTEPEGTNRRVIFEVDNKLWYFTSDGLTQYPYHGELADVLQFGNTVAELLEVDGVVKWLNKQIFPIIALDAPIDAPVMPKIKIGLKVNCFNDEYQREKLSPVYELKHAENPARITKATFNKANNGYAQSNVEIRVLNSLGVWSDWLELADAVNKEACKVQFKATYILTTLDGSDEAKVFDIVLEYVTDNENSAADVLEIFTTPQEYYLDLGTCYASLKHTEPLDAEIKAYIKFQAPTKRRENIVIGRGTGNYETYYLGTNGGIDPNINQNSLHITAGDINIVDFYYNTGLASVELKADDGVTIRASYEYDLPAEDWIEMAGEISQVYGDAGLYHSRFVYRLSNATNKKISAVKFSFTRNSGTIGNEILGTANGKQQIFVLPHRAKKETIQCNCVWTYDEESQILKITGAIDDVITISYDWCGIIPQIDSYACGWTPAT